MINLQQLNEIDFENISEWPFALKIGLLVFVFFLLISVGYFINTRIQYGKIRSAKLEEQEFKTELEQKYKKLARLRQYHLQNQGVGKALKQRMVNLPKTIDVSSFISDISKFGEEQHLEFELLKPMAEKKKAFYVNVPIQVVAYGTYHEFAMFIEDIVKTDYALSFHDLTITRVGQGYQGSKPLLIRLTIDLFRYVDVNQAKKGKVSEVKSS